MIVRGLVLGPDAAMEPVEAVIPVSPVTFRLTAELKVLFRTIVAVVVPCAPGATVSDEGLSVREKLGAGSTLMASSADLVTAPPVAVTVTG